MPDPVTIQQTIRACIGETMADCRVVPDLPPDRKPPRRPRGSDDERLDDARDRDDSSGWSLFIDYTDSRGDPSSRRITLIRCESRLGALPAIAAYCHEAEAYRLFRVDRIGAMALCGTGEVVDKEAHLALLRSTGLPFVNRGMLTVATILLFIARCDGHHHTAEWDAIEAALASYALRFDGTDEDVAKTMDRIRCLAPDSTDFANALCAIVRTPAASRRKVAKILIGMAAQVIDADGRHSMDELHWGNAMDRVLNMLLE